MFDYLTKFNQLPKELREKVSSPAVLAGIDELEKKYGVNLAALVMKVMVKEVDANGLAMHLAGELNLEALKAEQLAGELKEKVFAGAGEYLGIGGNKKYQIPNPQIPNPQITKSSNYQTSKFTNSAFFFSPEDEKEIRDLAAKTGGQTETAAVNEEQIKEKLDKMVAAININFGSELLAERFRKILFVYIKGIRDRIETKSTLMKSFDAGGLGFDAVSAEKVLTVAGGNKSAMEEKLEIKAPPRIKVPEDDIKNKKLSTSYGSAFGGEVRSLPAGQAGKNLEELKKAGMRDFEYDLAALASKKTSPQPPISTSDGSALGGKVGKLDTTHELPAPLKPSSEAKQIAAKSAIVQPPLITAAPLLRRTPPPETGGRKVRMEDIRAVPRVMSPVDELKFTDLINFRRLDKDPFKAVLKIKEKISLLEEEGYAKRLEGVRAWRSSAVNRIYLKMGEASIGESKPVDVIIEERKKSGKEYLNVDEFSAVMDLNKDLRF